VSTLYVIFIATSAIKIAVRIKTLLIKELPERTSSEDVVQAIIGIAFFSKDVGLMLTRNP